MELEELLATQTRQAPTLSDRSQLDVVMIHALMDSLFTIFSTMVGLRIRPGIPEPKTDEAAQGVASSLVGMNAQGVHGSVALSLTLPAIRAISQRMMHHEIDVADAEAADMAGELVNMLVGGVKRIMAEQGFDFDMQTPTLLLGEGHEIAHRCAGQTVSLPIEIDGAEDAIFYIELNFV